MGINCYALVIGILKRIQQFHSPHLVAQLLTLNWSNWRWLPGSTIWWAQDRDPRIPLTLNCAYADMEVDPRWPCGMPLVLSHNSFLWCLLQFVFPGPDQYGPLSQPESNTWRVVRQHESVASKGVHCPNRVKPGHSECIQTGRCPNWERLKQLLQLFWTRSCFSVSVESSWGEWSHSQS